MSILIPLELTFEFQGEAQTLHPILVEEQDDLLLVDVPYPGQLPLLEHAINSVGRSLDAVTAILITHDDIDHLGCLAEIKSRYPAIQILASTVEAPYVTGAVKSLRLQQAEAMYDATSVDQQRGALAFQRALEQIIRIPIDRELADEGVLSPFNDLQVITTPGHTPGHLSLFHTSSQTLISGDACVVENGHLAIANPHFTLDLEGAKSSIRKLSSLPIRTVYCYHGGLFEGDIAAEWVDIMKL